MKEREISLIDLMVEIMLHWRMIIVWMLVGGLMLGGFSYFRSKTSIAQQQEIIEQQGDEQSLLAQLEETLTPIQKNNVAAVRYYENFQDYYNQSLLMQLEAEKAVKTQLIFWVRADSLEQSQNIRGLYEAALKNGVMQWLAENNPNQLDANVSELITVADKETAAKTEIETERVFFVVEIIHLNEEDCTALADQVAEYIDFLHAGFSADIEPHDIILADRSCASAMDAELLNWQWTTTSNIIACKANANNLIKEFSADEQTYYNLLNEREAAKDSATEGKEDFVQPSEQEEMLPNPSASVKYILLGMIAFAFIYVFYIFVKYILNNKLHAADDVGEIYGISQLGRIPQKISYRKLFGFIDKWILKLRNSNKRTFSEEEAIGLAAVAVKMAVKKEAMSEVFCIGCDVKEKALKVAEQLQDILTKEGIKMSILSNVLYDQEALEQLSAAKCVFLLETAGSTFYNEIEKELELLKRQEITILGGIIVE